MSPQYYKVGARPASIIHAQFRLKCSNLNQHKYNMHLVESSLCQSCNNANESVTHFLLNCPSYNNSRQTMLSSIREDIGNDIDIDTNLLIYGNMSMDFESNKAIFLSVQKFIIETGRF